MITVLIRRHAELSNGVCSRLISAGQHDGRFEGGHLALLPQAAPDL
jgi:hypothetical protein